MPSEKKLWDPSCDRLRNGRTATTGVGADVADDSRRRSHIQLLTATADRSIATATVFSTREQTTPDRRCDRRGPGRHFLQVAREVARGFVAVRRNLLEAAVNDERQMRRNCSVHRVYRLWIGLDRRCHGLGRGGPRERPASGDGFIGDESQRELIRAGSASRPLACSGDM